MNVVVVLPSLNPDEKMGQTVRALIKEGFDDIIVVDDGSDDVHKKFFDDVRRIPGVTVLTHERNQGKGRAMKTAFSYILRREASGECGKTAGEKKPVAAKESSVGTMNRKETEPERQTGMLSGVVTVDGDGQHLPKDIRRCVEAMEETNPGKVILGVRDFTAAGIPAKSRMGNNITKAVFRFACGIRISDTQTGLRAIPYEYLPLMTEIEGERYEYETNQLLEMKRHHIPMGEVKIDTVYLDDNSSSHFHPFRDSFQIYKVIFKYLASSFGSFLVDMALFTLLNLLLGNRTDAAARLLLATAGARLVSSLVNYSLNRNLVFHSDEPVAKSMLKYYILCICQAALSYAGVYLLSEVLLRLNGGALESLVKLVVDSCLFLVSYRIQRVWIFRQE